MSEELTKISSKLKKKSNSKSKSKEKHNSSNKSKPKSDRKIKELLDLIKSDYKKNSTKLTTDELVKVLKKLSDNYYNTGESLVSDIVYDDLKDLLEKKDPGNPFLEEVGAPIKGTKEKVNLPYEMGSLTKIKPESGDLNKWYKKYKGPYVLSDKLDGASVQLYKDSNGKIFLYSRGNGTVGQDISHLTNYFVSEQILKNIPNGTSVRGELIISKKNFQKISSYMKNARNAVSGLVNSKTVDVKIAKITDMVTYSVLFPKYKHSEQIKLLKNWGFNVVENNIMKKMTEDDLKNYLLDRKAESIYEIDGVVCVDDSKVYTETGGYPDHAFAFKMLLEDQTVEANVVDIEWDISMDGYIKPRVKIEPVQLSGTTVTFATGFNAKYISDNKLGPGAIIKIVRSGEVIPYILEVLQPSTSGKPKMPDYKYEWNETEIDIIVDKSDKTALKTIKLKLLMHFFSTMGVKYLGEGILLKFIDAGLDSVLKILTAKRKDFADIEGIGDKMIKKIYDEINRAFQEVDLATFMGASHKFGRGMGVRKIEEVLAKYPKILKEDWSKKEMTEKLQLVEGFAEKSAKLFSENFKEFKQFYDEISKVIDISRFETDDSKNDTGKENNKDKLFNGEKFVFTGPRDAELEKFIKSNGGKITTSVSSNTFMLVYGEGADTNSNKFIDARKSKVNILSHEEFRKKYMTNAK